MVLSEYDLIIINTSGGKDSVCAIWQIVQLAKEQGYPMSSIHLSHADLGEMEWEGTKELVGRQAEFFNLPVHYARRRTIDGREENLIDHVERRGKWPSNVQRYCTSDHKRGPGGRVVRMLTKGQISRVLYVFGFRATESPCRKKKSALAPNLPLTTKKRTVTEYLPIHDWSDDKVWSTIRENKLPYHYAYDLGMPRLSCVFCIFSPLDALVVAGKANPDLFEKYIAVEKKIGHTFRSNFSIATVAEKIKEGYEPKTISNWTM